MRFFSTSASRDRREVASAFGLAYALAAVAEWRLCRLLYPLGSALFMCCTITTAGRPEPEFRFVHLAVALAWSVYEMRHMHAIHPLTRAEACALLCIHGLFAALYVIVEVTDESARVFKTCVWLQLHGLVYPYLAPLRRRPKSASARGAPVTLDNHLNTTIIGVEIGPATSNTGRYGTVATPVQAA